MAISDSQRAAIDALLKKGDLDGAHQMLTAAKEQADAAKAQPAKPRSPEQISLELLHNIVEHLGNHPRLTALLTELENVVNPPSEEAPK